MGKAVTPYQQAQALYRDQPTMAGGRSFQEDLALHVAHGFVWSSPTALIMAKLTHSSYSPDQVARHWLSPEQGDCWFVYLAAGDLREFLRVVPFEVPFVCFYRRGRFRRYSLARLAAMAEKPLDIGG